MCLDSAAPGPSSKVITPRAQSEGAQLPIVKKARGQHLTQHTRRSLPAALRDGDRRAPAPCCPFAMLLRERPHAWCPDGCGHHPGDTSRLSGPTGQGILPSCSHGTLTVGGSRKGMRTPLWCPEFCGCCQETPLHCLALAASRVPQDRKQWQAFVNGYRPQSTEGGNRRRSLVFQSRRPIC